MSIKIEVQNYQNENELNEFVTNPENMACLWHSLEWKQILEKEYSYKPFYLLAKENDTVCGVLPLFQIKSMVTGNRLVSLPFSYYCGIVTSSVDVQIKLVNEAQELANKLNCNYLELKMQKPLQEDVILKTRLLETTYYYTSILKLYEDSNENWKKLDTRRTRWAINKAKRSGVEIKTETDINDLKIFYNLKVKTRRKHGSPTHSLKFFKSIMEKFKREDLVKLWVAVHDKQIISALIFYTFKDTVMPAYIAADEKYNSFMPSNLLYWNAIEWGCNNGYKYFDFGRTEPNNEDLLKFKTKWGCDNYKIPYYYYPIVPNLMSKNRDSTKAGIITGVWKKLPVPILKILGPKLIKHLG
ncbi:MAG: GNAT family N-acetyltransferase [Candidatus Methanoperedens sp.]|nr:GNAT family N-acetyltransferase [Candidatus Methanoperedens sp.]